MIQIIDASSEFFADLKKEAAACGVSSGALIRALLPFNESTSSGDQADVSENNAHTSNVSSEIIKKYRPFAISLRSLIRVKMADEEDLKQVFNHISKYSIQIILSLGKGCNAASQTILR